MKLDGTRIVLTGASSGIGRALACELSAAGAELALVAGREPEPQALATELPGVAYVIPADLSQPGRPPRSAPRQPRRSAASTSSSTTPA